MRFSEEQYKCLEAHIRRRIPWYLDIHLNFEEQDGKQVEALEDEIRASFPLFNHYKHAWPIRVIVTRVLRKSSGMACVYGAPAPPYTQSSSYPFGGSQIAESEPSPQSPHSRTHRCPPLSRYHAAPWSIPPQAKDTLSFLNMEDELAPALHFLGVRTDAQFDKVRRMRGEQKTQLLADTDDIRLTPLQRWVMMYMIFEK
ncbi:hypothetical protein C8R46DRAFT_1061614 [Mycena filopes]|nr:hypothetical protein C8R46DRAFT_1061614 [Mycena filopes]